MYWFSVQPEVPVASSDSPSSISKTADTTNRAATDTSGLFTVEIYESGAGLELYQSTAASLALAGYDVKNLGKSQFEYDKTYIWYRSSLEEQAHKVGEALAGRDVSYRESKNEGLFDILVYLGKK